MNKPLTPACAAVHFWVAEVVVGHNFCPFARREVERETLAYHDCRSSSIAETLELFADAVQQLLQDDRVETSLLVLSQGFTDFNDYLELLDYAQLWLQQEDLEGTLQLASFHPHYQFAGTAADDVTNYTNRAPYPVLHILREASLERVLKRYPTPERIPEDNCARAEELGSAYFEQVLAQARTAQSK
ncbi:DUF1415 domain-containing protein [Pseudidiomarina sediminum]|uniref:DUF1415 domain-containing protein n=1 Tax=Pseudidiomarina sediminum TaxID=431675 RepID=A0A432ZA07_9GAMM|nr:DUF1415 domain-containing protein [Pseudidiomarina sediminum]RUO74787.1 DUF1415 domain-containing protein [Pseudidiomarina sediminum]